jgi:hypothetical protein
MNGLSRRLIVLAAGVVGLIASVAPSFAAEPKIEIPETRKDFGRVFERKEYVHDFVVYNRGDANLEIKSVRPACGCTVTKFDEVIAPGKQGKIEFVLDGEKVHGEFNKTAAVTSNDPTHPIMTIAVSGIEIPFLDIQPSGTVYLNGRYDEHVERVVTVASNEKDGQNFKILRLTSNLDDKITYKLEDAGPGKYNITIYKNPKLPTLMTYGNLYLHTTSKEVPTSTLQVHVVTKGSIDVAPQMVNFGAVKFAEVAGAGQSITRGVIVSKASGDFAIKDIQVNNPSFKAWVEPVQEGKQYRVQVTFTPPLKTQATQNETAEMIIHTDDPSEPAIKLQVAARAI